MIEKRRVICDKAFEVYLLEELLLRALREYLK
jgi:hypothetical protein